MMTRDERPLAAVILAAGKGTRMNSDLHKVLHPLMGKPMIVHLLNMVEDLGVTKKIVVVGEGRQQVMSAVHNVEFAIQDKQMGTGHAVMTCRGHLNGFIGDVLVLYGDVPLISQATIEKMRATHHKSIGGQQPVITVLGFRPQDTKQYGRLVMSDDEQLEAIVEYKEASAEQRQITFCNSGIMMVRGEELFVLLDQIDNHNSASEYYLTDLVAVARQNGEVSAAVETNPLEVTGVNSQAELAILEREIKES